MLIKYRPSEWFGLEPSGTAAWDGTFRTFDSLRREMDRLFSGYERTLDGLGALARGADPEFHLDDRGASLVLTTDLPGITDKDLELTVTADTVVLRGQRKVESPEGYSAHHQERAEYRFDRAYRLPIPVDAAKAEATLKNGVLTVTLPKAAEAQPRAITVKST